MALDSECLFCKIIQGEIPATIVRRNENVVAFLDINPKAPTHVVLVPTIHVDNVAELANTSAPLVAELFQVADEIATTENLDGYRTVFNTGADGGQTVFHAHLHLLGGRALTWPPG